jgi:hypothetical protein
MHAINPNVLFVIESSGAKQMRVRTIFLAFGSQCVPLGFKHKNQHHRFCISVFSRKLATVSYIIARLHSKTSGKFHRVLMGVCFRTYLGNQTWVFNHFHDEKKQHNPPTNKTNFQSIHSMQQRQISLKIAYFSVQEIQAK